MTKQEEYFNEQEKFGNFLAKKKYAGKVLKQHGYEIFDVHQANEDFRKVMKLDEITEIAGVYVTKEKQKNGKTKTVEHIEPITKANFWNAFYLPIWKNLQDNEKIKALEWFFETENENRNLGINHISYFPEKNSGHVDAAGYFYDEKKYLYLDLGLLDPNFDKGYKSWKDGTNFSLVSILAHELMHARQRKYMEGFKPDMSADLYTLSLTPIFENYAYAYKFNPAIRHGIYRASLHEKAAELQGLKTIKKFLDLNEKKFGVDQNSRNIFERYKKSMLFIKPVYDKEKKEYKPNYGIYTNEKVIFKGQRDNLTKLIMLNNIYKYELFYHSKLYKMCSEELNKLSQKNELSEDMLIEVETYKEDLAEYKEIIKDDKKKIAFIKSTFFKTLETGKLPEDFNEKEEFEILNLVEEKKSEYVLPKRLREEEIEFEKMLEKK